MMVSIRYRLGAALVESRKEVNGERYNTYFELERRDRFLGRHMFV